MRTLMAGLALAAGAGAVALHSGCSGTPAPAAPTIVRGRVSFQGQPVPGAMVVFTPDRDRGSSGKPIRAETGPDGVFELPSPPNAPVPSGWYRVTIAPPASTTGAWELVPSQLRRPDTSTIVREVATGKEHFFELAIDVQRTN